MANGKPNDTRKPRMIALLDELLVRGVIPSCLEIDGMIVEVAYVKDRDDAHDPMAKMPGAPVDNPRPPGYRERARQELRERIRSGS